MSSTRATSASHSSSSTLHTANTTRPPGFARVAADLRIVSASADRRAGSVACKRAAISGRRRSVPVPVHGASTNTRSKSAGTSPTPTVQSTARSCASGKRRRSKSACKASSFFGYTSVAHTAPARARPARRTETFFGRAPRRRPGCARPGAHPAKARRPARLPLARRTSLRRSPHACADPPHLESGASAETRGQPRWRQATPARIARKRAANRLFSRAVARSTPALLRLRPRA